MTVAENILQVAENDLDESAAGMQLATSTDSIGKVGAGKFKLTNDNVINNLAGAVSQWTNQNVTLAGSPVCSEASLGGPCEYSEVTDFKGLNIAPDYYLADQTNNIGKIMVGTDAGLKGFVRGQGGIYGLDLSHAPVEQTVNIGFRCAK